MTQVRSDLLAEEAKAAEKWSIRQVRSGRAGDVVWVMGLLNVSGGLLREVKITHDLGQLLQDLGSGAIITKIFACGTTKKLEKHEE